MMRERHYEEPNDNKTVLPAIIKPKFASARNCIVPPCQSCLLARARKHSPNVLQTRLLDNHEGAITRDQYRLVWAKKVSLAAICLDISSASFGILFSYCRKYHIPVPL